MGATHPDSSSSFRPPLSANSLNASLSWNSHPFTTMTTYRIRARSRPFLSGAAVASMRKCLLLPQLSLVFVIIFRQGPRPLTETEKQHRDEETHVWARTQNAAGHKLDPHILAPESEYRGPEHSAVSSDGWPVTALLFLEARDLNEATRIAEADPALHHGATVEVRPWAPPVRNVPQAKAAATP